MDIFVVQISPAFCYFIFWLTKVASSSSYCQKLSACSSCRPNFTNSPSYYAANFNLYIV